MHGSGRWGLLVGAEQLLCCFIPLQGWDLGGQLAWLLSNFLPKSSPTPTYPGRRGVRAGKVCGVWGLGDP